MQATTFYKHLEKNSPAPLYLFKSNDDFLTEEAWQRMVEEFVPDAARRWNGERLSAKETSVEDVLDRLTTLPMLGGRRVMMVEHIEEWKKDQRRLLEQYATRPNLAATAVFTTTLQHGWKKLENLIEKSGIVVNFPAPTARDAPLWVMNRIQASGKRISHQAASSLVEQVGTDLHQLEQELRKVCLFVGDGNEIEENDVLQVVSRQRSFNVFELTRYVGQGRPELAVASLRNLLAGGEPPLPILALLSRHIRLLWQIKDAVVRKIPTREMQTKLRLPPGVIKQYIHQGKIFSCEELRRIHEAIVNTDLDLKTTALDPERVLESLILHMCRIKGLARQG